MVGRGLVGPAEAHGVARRQTEQPADRRALEQATAGGREPARRRPQQAHAATGLRRSAHKRPAQKTSSS